MRFFSDHKKKKIVILLGHPNAETLCGSMAMLYEAAAKKAGHEVTRFNIGELKFDPILHKGYKVIQNTEPDLVRVQEAIRAADHFVIIYPVWWVNMPAILKGFFDRIWLPGFAFRYRKTPDGRRKIFWDRLLLGKTARIITFSSTHPWLLFLTLGSATHTLAWGILRFAGMQTATTAFGPSEAAPEWKKNEWRKKVVELATWGE